SSPDPSRWTIICSSGTTTLTRVCAYVDSTMMWPCGRLAPAFRVSGGRVTAAPAASLPRLRFYQPAPTPRRGFPPRPGPPSRRPRPGGNRPGSPGGPLHDAAAQQVAVQVEDGLPGRGTGVEDHPVPALGDPLGAGDLPGLPGDLVEEADPGGPGADHVGVVLTRNDQHVRGRLRVDVAEG